MSNYEPPPEKSEPWWNDGDKIGGLMSTIFMLLVAAVLTMLIVKFGFWLFS